VGSGNVLPGNEVTFEVVDGQVQGSARRIIWNGEGQVLTQLASYTPGIDLSPYGNSDTTLTFRVRVDAAIEATAVNLAVHCEWPCVGEIPLRATLAALTPGEWHDIAVPLQCFLYDGGVDLTKVNAPFLLYANGPMQLSIEDVRWLPDTAAGAPSCSSFSRSQPDPALDSRRRSSR
jgi:beta-glucosidase